MFRVTKIEFDSEGRVHPVIVGEYVDKKKAMAAAKKAAGARAKFVSRGIDYGYVGNAAMVWVT